MYCSVFQAITTATIPATDPAMVAIIVTLSLDKPPLLEGPGEDVEVGVGCPRFPTLPGVATWRSTR